VGRARRRARRERLLQRPPPGLPAAEAPAASPPPGQGAERPWSDRQWRKAERRRILLASLLPGPPQDVARRGGLHLLSVVVLHGALVCAVGLLLARAASGQWLPSYAAVVVLFVAVASQFASRAVNGRAGR
jgi:hypothetical protein